MRRFVILVNPKDRTASLQECNCPRCCGYISFSPPQQFSDGGGDDQDNASRGDDEDYYDDDYYHYDDDDDNDAVTLQAQAYEDRIDAKWGHSRKGGRGLSRGGVGSGGGGNGGAVLREKARERGARKAEAADRRQRVKAREARKRELRAKEGQAQLAARRVNSHRRLGASGLAVGTELAGTRRGDPAALVVGGFSGSWRHSVRAAPAPRVPRRSSSHRDSYGGGGGLEDATGSLLSAEQLGLENGANYERLLQILQGDDISPEDFDLLLQLDTNNAKQT